MKTRAALLLAWLTAVSAATVFAADAANTPPKPHAAPPIPPRFLQVREKIKILFQHRIDTPPALDPAGNPFRPPGAPIVAVAANAESPAATSLPSNDLALLQEAAAALKVSGTVEKDGLPHLIINTRPYKKGDVVPSRADGQAVYLRIREITRRSVTFELNDAEMTLKF